MRSHQGNHHLCYYSTRAQTNKYVCYDLCRGRKREEGREWENGGEKQNAYYHTHTHTHTK